MGLPRGSPRGSPGEPLKHPPPPRTMLRMIAYKTPNGLGTPVKGSRVLPVKILKPKLKARWRVPTRINGFGGTPGDLL